MRKGTLVRRVACGVMLLAPLAATAQVAARAAQQDTARSWLPFTTHGYVGASVGQSAYDLDCAAGFSCDDYDVGFKVYTGGRLRDIVGLELAYIDLGKVDRNGNSSRAYGANLSLIGNLPVAQQFSVFGKVGTTYGWTRTFVASDSGAPSGEESGFGLSFGAGLNYDVNRNWAVRAEWERHRFEFVRDDERVDLYTVGFNYKF